MAGGKSFAERLDHLFSTVRRRDGGEFSYEEVARTISQTGVTISQSYVWQLRQGKKDNPTLKHVQAVANFFGVPPSYFFDDSAAARIDEQLDRLHAEQQRLRRLTDTDEARLVAMRTSELDPDRRKLVMGLLDAVHQAQQAEREANPHP